MAYVGVRAENFTVRNGFAAISPGYKVNDHGFDTNAGRKSLARWTLKLNVPYAA